MPAQASYLRIPQAPGAIVLGEDDLTLDDLLEILNAGSVSAVATLRSLQAALFGPFVLPARVVLSDADAVFEATDVALLINKTVAGATPVTLPTPRLSRLVLVKDMKGDGATNNITLDAGAGKLINGQQTLVMNVDWATTVLLGMSATQWGTVI
jgi:hypothetical protein